MSQFNLNLQPVTPILTFAPTRFLADRGLLPILTKERQEDENSAQHQQQHRKRPARPKGGRSAPLAHTRPRKPDRKPPDVDQQRQRKIFITAGRKRPLNEWRPKGPRNVTRHLAGAPINLPIARNPESPPKTLPSNSAQWIRVATAWEKCHDFRITSATNQTKADPWKVLLLPQKCLWKWQQAR